MQIEKTAPATRSQLSTEAPGAGGRVGVLLVNLGTPEGTSFAPMWRYLREFLSDPRVIELPRVVWYPILYGLVLGVQSFQQVAETIRGFLQLHRH